MPRNTVLPYNPKLKQRARELRKNCTESEKILWEYIRRKQLGYEFHRQIPVDQYIVDFYCHELMLAIEIDGTSHDTDDAKVNDAQRQAKLEGLGVSFLRFRDELVKTNPEFVVKVIERWIGENLVAEQS